MNTSADRYNLILLIATLLVLLTFPGCAASLTTKEGTKVDFQFSAEDYKAIHELRGR